MEAITEKKIEKAEINRFVDLLISQDASEHLEALHDMYHGYMKNVVNEMQEVEPDTEKIKEVEFSYQWLRDFLREIVKAEKKIK